MKNIRTYIDRYIAIGISSSLNNNTAITLLRSLIKPFPAVDEALRILNYKIKKKLTKTILPLSKIEIESSRKINASKSFNSKRLLFDVSGISIRDVNTGIQRAVKAILINLMTTNNNEYSIVPVRISADGIMRHASKYSNHLMQDHHDDDDDDSELSIIPGDIFFSADLHLPLTFYTLQPLRKQGLRVIFTIYDLFALNLDVFPKAFEMAFKDWINGVMITSDAIICDSCSVANEVKKWLEEHSEMRKYALPIGYFHLGADLESGKTTAGITPDDEITIKALRNNLTLLMVGTVEPRKGHASALEAIEMLWNEGIQINLVIVGKEGWRSHDLVRRLRRHPQRNKQLFWLEKASDALLVQLYAQSTALLAASFAEGFGLPLIEAAYYGLPIIARDIPVFHEVAGDFAFYFPNTDSVALADSLRQWLRLHAEGKAPQSKDMPYLTWAQSTQQLLKVILEDNWYTVYQPADENKTTHTEQ